MSSITKINIDFNMYRGFNCSMKKPVDRTELEAQAKRLGFKLTRAGPTTQTSIRVYEESLKDFKKLVSELNLRTVDAYSDALDLFVSQTRKKLEKSK